MAKLVATLKAIVTRLVFGTHGFVAIWQVTTFKKNPVFWYLCTPILTLLFEGLFTLTIKDSQEWKWFCPSVFLYLSSVVPSIWLLELEKLDRRLQTRAEQINLTTINLEDLKGLDNLFGVHLKIPAIQVDAETWVTLIEQFLMLVLIVGRWMLPKGDLTRDQLSQLLLVYIGTAADIIEFFDSFKDERIAREPPLVLLTLAIWSWSLMQFTVVLTATKSRKSRLTTSSNIPTARKFKKRKEGRCASCCSIDVWGIVLNILLQDAPFFVFRLLLIFHYNIISYMNVFFTCKNTLVILLQLYRLYVVHSETRKLERKSKRKKERSQDISIVSGPDIFGRSGYHKERRSTEKHKARSTEAADSPEEDDGDDLELSRLELENKRRKQRRRPPLPGRRGGRQDTGYSTASSPRGSLIDSPRCHKSHTPITDMEDRPNKRKSSSKATMTNREELKYPRKVATSRDREDSRSRSEESKSDRVRRSLHSTDRENGSSADRGKTESDNLLDSDVESPATKKTRRPTAVKKKDRYMKREAERDTSEDDSDVETGVRGTRKGRRPPKDDDERV